MALAIYSTQTGKLRRIIKNSAGENTDDKTLGIMHPALADETTVRVKDNLTIEDITMMVKRIHNKLVPK